MEKLSDHPIANITQALETAEQRLGVSPILTPDYFVNPNVDELSVITYIGSINAAHPSGPPEPERPPSFFQVNMSAHAYIYRERERERKKEIERERKKERKK